VAVLPRSRLVADQGSDSEPVGREARWGGPKTALVGLLALAAGLRLIGIRHGLPFPLLNPDEGNIVPRAWRMVHGAGLDPNWFDYPSLTLYLLAPLQAGHEAPSYVAARLVVASLGVAGVAATWWLGRRAYGVRAAAVAAASVAVATTHVAYSHVAVTDVPLVLGVAISLALMISGRLELAGVVVGLSIGVKYPGVLLLVPLVVAGWGRWGRLALSLVLVPAAFFVASPFVFLDAGEAAGDAFRVQRLAREGWLGFENDQLAAIVFAERLWEAIGPALIVAAAGVGYALVRRELADRVLVSFVVVYFLNLLTLGAHFDRYVLPLLPALGALAGRFRTLAPVTLLLLVVPLTWSVQDVRRLMLTDTRLPALAWIERNVPAGSRVAADPSTPPLEGLETIRLRLPGPGRSPDPRRDLARLRREGVEYVLVTGAVADRVLAARARYPDEAAFYDDLERRADELLRVEPGGDLTGPWVALYRLAAPASR